MAARLRRLCGRKSRVKDMSSDREPGERLHRRIDMRANQYASVSLLGEYATAEIKLHIFDGLDGEIGQSLAMSPDEAEELAELLAVAAHDGRIPERRDEPLPGKHRCPEGCWLSLIVRERYQDREECPECGATLEVVESVNASDESKQQAINGAYTVLEGVHDEWDEYTEAGHKGHVEQAMKVLESHTDESKLSEL